MCRVASGAGILAAAWLLIPGAGGQEIAEVPTTRIVVRAVARDATLIGDGVGGAYIRVVDAKTGATLAEGRQEGGTGDTERIMNTPRTRGMSTYDTDGAAVFTAELQINEPTIINISATGPLGHPQATRSATKQILIVPGGDIEGDGVILELHGFIVEIQMPEPLAAASGRLEVQARVRMMCGCPLTPDGIWDSDKVEIAARLHADGAIVAETPMVFAGEASIFTAGLAVPAGLQARDLELEVVASDRKKENFGRHAIPLGLMN